MAVETAVDAADGRLPKPKRGRALHAAAGCCAGVDGLPVHRPGAAHLLGLHVLRPVFALLPDVPPRGASSSRTSRSSARRTTRTDPGRRFRQVDRQHRLLHRRLGAADDGHRAAGWRCCSTSRCAVRGTVPDARTTSRSSPRSWSSAILWKWLYNGDYGLFNYYLLKAHLIDQPLLWLSGKNLAMPAVILMSVWARHRLLDGGLPRRAPGDPGGALRVGEAGRRRRLARLRYITVPMLAPTTLFLLVIGIIGSLQVFTQIFVMTSGGPVNRTTTMVYYMYPGRSSTTTWATPAPWRSPCSSCSWSSPLIQLRLNRQADQ